jgi:hypothetical protein
MLQGAENGASDGIDEDLEELRLRFVEELVGGKFVISKVLRFTNIVEILRTKTNQNR